MIKYGVTGRIYEVFADNEPKTHDVSHSYVVLDNQKEEEPALNQQQGTLAITVAEAQKGEDITDEIMNAPWDKL